MAVANWTAHIEQAFHDDPALRDRVIGTVASDTSGTLLPLLNDIARYIVAHQGSGPQTNGASKKRKLDGEQTVPSSASSAGAALQNRTTAYECDGVSFSVPARKKLKLELSYDAQEPRRAEIRLLNPQDNAAEYALPTSVIDQAFCLPVPEKQARQWNFCVFPIAGATDAAGALREQVVFTMNEPKLGAGTDEVDATESHLNALLQPFGRRVIRPDDAEFASSIPQSHRKGEKAYHVKGHRGSKEGYLFFLSTGIVFGFKKPLAYFPFAAIESISYTSVLQRTFNLVIAAAEPGAAGAAPEVKEVEFSMLDQTDFAGIDEYVKRHGLNDASMAADRRAKAYNVNKDNTRVLSDQDVNGGQHNVDGTADAVEKTEQELQDEEDELEEDYEASGGESDGEGDYSEDEEEADGDEEVDEAEGGE